MRDQDQRQRGHFGNWRKVLDRIERQFVVDRRIDDHSGVEGHHQCVAVGVRLGDDIGADIAGGAGAVIHQYLLAEIF